MNKKSSARVSKSEYDKQIALVLQGGGALGSYQAGVYEAMAEYGYQPDWVAGISIGAINSAIIAGNTPQDRVARLRAFWEQVSSPSASWVDLPLETWQDTMRRLSAMSALLFGQPGFFRPNLLALLDHRDITDQLLRYVRSQRNVGTIGRFRPHQRTRDSVQRRSRERPDRQLCLFRQRPPNHPAGARHGERRITAWLSGDRNRR
jgi:predicted acylesterase/phospholipase RssA